jgi:lipopolysaccharide biosynthesis regulator YciM
MVARRIIGAQINSITNITVQLVSYPQPTVKWHTYTGRDWTVLTPHRALSLYLQI